MDPEEILRRKFRAKCLFRALGRLVLANAYWLIEGVDHYEGFDDVRRRVVQAVRGKTKKRLLNIEDKALLNKPAEERTDQEKQYIYKIIGGLKCFKRYPNHVKKKLAAVTYYKYYGPNRVIVKQHQEAHALYFIVEGDLVVSQNIFDDLLQQYVSVDVGIMHAGDMFGEVSLLHNIPRTATVTSIGHCELLALMKHDFKNILLSSIQKQWDEVKNAMSAFTYFDALDEVARREGCIVAKMRSYETNETIFGDGMGVHNFVYFVLKGRCQMIESLQVIVKTHLGKEHYTLYDPYIPQEESEEDFEKKYGLTPFSSTSRDNENKSDTQVKPKTSKILEENLKDDELDDASSEKVYLQTTDERDHHPRASVRFSVFDQPQFEGQQLKQLNLRTYFMQVCQMNPGSSFGFGENMRDRRIIALTPVDCMLMPKVWLLQRNTANIWTRIQYYLEKKIPTKKKLFQEFVNNRRWIEFRDQMVSDVLCRSNTVNWTSVHDVPYSIRMEELTDISLQ